MTSFRKMLKYQQKQMKNESIQKHTIQSNMGYCEQNQYIFNDFDGLAGRGLCWPGLAWVGLAWLGLGLGWAWAWPKLALVGLGLAGLAGVWLGLGDGLAQVFCPERKDWLAGAAWAGWAGLGWLGLAPEIDPNDCRLFHVKPIPICDY